MTDRKTDRKSRRIAQRQSASIHTEETAAFDSRAAYQNFPRILFLSHCVPYPPDKGERIRAYRDLMRLASLGPVHLACIAQSRQEEDAAQTLRQALGGQCASLHVERIRPRRALLRAAAQFAAGACLTESYYGAAGLHRYVAGLGRVDVTVAYSSAMAQYAPPGVPLVLDMVDVDSEKWAQYAAWRRPGWAYAMEGRRLRRREAEYAGRAAAVVLTTRHEAAVFAGIAVHPRVVAMENGVDFDYFDPQRVPATAALRFPRLVFVGAMDYFPNAQGICRFATGVFPQLRRQCAGLELVIVGRNPTRAVRQLASGAGVTVTGGVADVRPYLAEALAVVAPLEIARGIQNKVLEALAMGKRVLASPAVAATLGSLPEGVVCCRQAADYAAALPPAAAGWPYEAAIRQAAGARFTWERNLDLLSREVAGARATPVAAETAPEVLV
jgi:sugar transferase (PEP-CTERM/EpsH1 system associated)